MVRHKKDNFGRGGKKFSSTPHHRAEPRGGDDHDTENGISRPPFKAACWDLGHCDPKRCSGKRLMQFGLMRELSIGHKHSGVVISYVPSFRYCLKFKRTTHADTIDDQTKCETDLVPGRSRTPGTIWRRSC